MLRLPWKFEQALQRTISMRVVIIVPAGLIEVLSPGVILVLGEAAIVSSSVSSSSSGSNIENNNDLV
jgi:hypothetical protein